MTEGISFLRKKYQETVHEPLSHRIKEGNMLTFSAGVCIAHYKEPLSLVLSQARKLEKDAKASRKNKNAIGIGVIPGSGQLAEVVLPFEKFTHLETIIKSLQFLDFSNAFVSKARTELALFVDKEGKLDAELLLTSQSLLDRAVRRAYNIKKEHEESAENFEVRKNQKIDLLQEAVKDLLDANSHKLKCFSDALDIADFIVRQTHISSPKTEAVEA